MVERYSTNGLEFKPNPIEYTIEHKYNPDFKHSTGSKQILIEAKGFFQDASEAAKYKWVREALPEDTELVFVFEKPETRLHYLQRRKDGSKMSMAEWAEKNGFRWFTIDTIGEILD